MGFNALESSDVDNDGTFDANIAAAGGYVQGVSQVMSGGRVYTLNVDAVLQAARGNTDIVDQTVLPESGDGSSSQMWVTASIETFYEAINGRHGAEQVVNTLRHGNTDYGAATYKRTGIDSLTPSSGDEVKFSDADGVEWELIHDGVVCVYQLGCVGDGSDETARLELVNKIPDSTLDLCGGSFSGVDCSLDGDVKNGELIELSGSVNFGFAFVDFDLLEKLCLRGSHVADSPALSVVNSFLFSPSTHGVMRDVIVKNIAQTEHNTGGLYCENCEWSDMAIHGGATGLNTYAMLSSSLATYFHNKNCKIIGPATRSVSNPGGFIQSHSDTYTDVFDGIYEDLYTIRIGCGAASNLVGSVDAYQNARSMKVIRGKFEEPTYTPLKITGSKTIEIEGPVLIKDVYMDDIVEATAPLVIANYTNTHGALVPDKISIKDVFIEGFVSPNNKVIGLDLSCFMASQNVREISVENFVAPDGLRHNLFVSGYATKIFSDSLKLKDVNFGKSLLLSMNMLDIDGCDIVVDGVTSDSQDRGLQSYIGITDTNFTLLNSDIKTDQNLPIFIAVGGDVTVDNTTFGGGSGLQCTIRNSAKVEVTNNTALDTAFFAGVGNQLETLSGNTGVTSWDDRSYLYGTTANRPAAPELFQTYDDTDLTKEVKWWGVDWRDSAGNVA